MAKPIGRYKCFWKWPWGHDAYPGQKCKNCGTYIPKVDDFLDGDAFR